MLAYAAATVHDIGMNRVTPEQARCELKQMVDGHPEELRDVLLFPHPELPDITARMASLVEFVTDQGSEVRFDSNVLCEKTENATYIRRIKDVLRPAGPKAVFEINLKVLDIMEEFAPVLYGFKYAEDDWLFMLDIAWPQKSGRQRYLVALESTAAHIFHPDTHQLEKVEASHELIRSISWWFE